MVFQHRRFQLVLLILTLLLWGCSSPQAVAPDASESVSQPVEVPEDWVEIEVGDIFTFFTPADLEEVDIEGVDSFVKQYKSDSIEVSTDYGWYSAEAFCYPDPDFFIECDTDVTTINGKDADILWAKVKMEEGQEFYVAQLYVPRLVVEKFDDGFETAEHLGMFVRSPDESLQNDLLKIVQSVRFTEEFLSEID